MSGTMLAGRALAATIGEPYEYGNTIQRAGRQSQRFSESPRAVIEETMDLNPLAG